MKSRVPAVAFVAFAFGAVSGFWLSNMAADVPPAVPAPPAPPPRASAGWLTGPADEKFAQIERQLRGFDVTMAEVGYRYDELVGAAKIRNWNYAQYQTEKIAHTIRLGMERRPKRAKSAGPFLNESVPPLLEAIEARNPEKLDFAITNLHAGCIQCHRAENVLYMGQQRFSSIQPMSAAGAQAIKDYRRILTPEDLERADRSQGRLIFSKNCANCHRLFAEGGAIGPDLTPLQRSDLDHLLTRMVDPNAMIGHDYRAVIVVTVDGRTITGLVVQEDENALTIQTATDRTIIPKAEIEERLVSKVSMMPEGLLQKLSNEQVRDLIGYLQGSDQAPLPAEKTEQSGV